MTFAGEDRVNYETWSEALAEHIKVGNTIEADVDFTEKVSGGQTYFHNKVVQIYIDGQPMKSKGRGFTPDSPEKIQSIESQKRADLICQLWIAGKLKDDDPLVERAIDWLYKLGEPTLPAQRQPGASPVAKPSPAKGEAKGGFANPGEFFAACMKPPINMNRTQVLKYLGVETVEGFNLEDTYTRIRDVAEGK